MREETTAGGAFDPNVVQKGSEAGFVQTGVLQHIRPNQDHGDHDYAADERHVYDIAGLAVELAGRPVSFRHKEQEGLETRVHSNVHEGHLQHDDRANNDQRKRQQTTGPR